MSAFEPLAAESDQNLSHLVAHLKKGGRIILCEGIPSAVIIPSTSLDLSR
jgi:antitoxin (DNA-binding transcriptional repressor) of toxin-antitoxin stability system